MTELETQLIGLFRHFIEDSATRDEKLVALLSDVSGHLEKLEAVCQLLMDSLKN